MSLNNAVQMQCKCGANSSSQCSFRCLLLSVIGKYGTTKYNWRRLAKGFLDLIVISFWQKYSVRPIHMFGGFGMLLSILGILSMTYMIVQRLFFGVALSDRPLFLLAILIIVIGVQFIVSGILADIMLKVYYGQSGKKNYLIEQFLK